MTTTQQTEKTEPCEACGGCGILITSWDGVLHPKDGQVLVDTCDQCTTGKLHRADASEAIALHLKTNIVLVFNEGYSFKDAIDAPLATVEALLNKWNAEGKHLGDLLVEERKKNYNGA